MKEKENFEWFFNCELSPQTVQEKIVYKYTAKPVRREQCVSCKGVGHFESLSECWKCKGSGKVKNKEGNNVECGTCNGKGKVLTHTQCSNCVGKGALEFPQSPPAKVASQFRYEGWRVQVVTNPPGASVKTLDPQTGQYVSKGSSNSGKSIEWLSPEGKPAPILVEYQDKQIKVLPYDSKGSPSKKIEIDFAGATPDIRLGKLSQ